MRSELTDLGYRFDSDTDTETIAHLLHYVSQTNESFDAVVAAAIKRLEGAFALAIIDEQTPGVLWVARQGSPLVIGVGHGEHFVGSDQLALLHVTDRFIFLDEGDSAKLRSHTLEIYDGEHQLVNRPLVRATTSNEQASKGQYRHFMAKEIYEQPNAVLMTLQGRLGKKKILTGVLGPNGDQLLAEAKAVKSSHAVPVITPGLLPSIGLKIWSVFLAKSKLQVNTVIEKLSRYRTHYGLQSHNRVRQQMYYLHSAISIRRMF